MGGVEKRGKIVFPYAFDELLSSSDDFNFTHYLIDGVKVRMSLCPVPFSKLPPMPDGMVGLFLDESFPIFIKIYKQMVFTFVFDPERTALDGEMVRLAKRHFIDAFGPSELEYKMEAFPSDMLEDIYQTIGRIPRFYPMGFEIISAEMTLLESLQEECRNFYEPLISQHHEAQKQYSELMKSNNIHHLFKKAVEVYIGGTRAIEDEYNLQMEMLEWLKNTCALRLFGEKLPNKS